MSFSIIFNWNILNKHTRSESFTRLGLTFVSSECSLRRVLPSPLTKLASVRIRYFNRSGSWLNGVGWFGILSETKTSWIPSRGDECHWDQMAEGSVKISVTRVSILTSIDTISNYPQVSFGPKFYIYFFFICGFRPSNYMRAAYKLSPNI